MKLPSFLSRSISPLEHEVMSWYEEVWEVWARDHNYIHARYSPGWQLIHDEHGHHHFEILARDALRESLRRLRVRFGDKELSVLAADLYFDPKSWQSRYSDEDRRGALLGVTSACVAETPPLDVISRTERRLHAASRDDTPIRPNMNECLELLRVLSARQPALSGGCLDLAEKALRGDVAGLNVWTILPLLEWLWRHGRFPYEAFAQLASKKEYLVDKIYDPNLQPRYAPGGEFRQVLYGYSDNLALDIARSGDKRREHLVEDAAVVRGGPELLLGAARMHTQRPADGRLVYLYSGAYKPSGMVNLARGADCSGILPAEREALVRELKTFPADTLRTLLPISYACRQILAQALGWERALPLVEVLPHPIPPDATRTWQWSGDVTANSPDPTSGILDARAVREAVATAEEPLAREVLGLYREMMPGHTDAFALVEAALGWDTTWVAKGLPKRKQLAVKAYGLLPLEREEEVLERYRWIRQFERESRQFGPQRRGTEGAAAQVALANLALNGGYGGADRLEWAMQARLGEGGAAVGRKWSIGEYEAELDLAGTMPRLVYRRGEKELRSVPKAVKESEAYDEIREASDTLKRQASGLRSTLEGYMGSATPLDLEDLSRLMKLPLARTMLCGLVLRASDGTLGLAETDGRSLVLLDGTARAIDEPVLIAHPLHLHQAGRLAGWQREIVRRRLVQPFKQAYRELYLLTPAERDTGTYSSRFAGHELDARVVARLLGGRGWEIASGEAEPPRKLYREAGVWAYIDFDGLGHYFTESDIVTSSRVYFRAHPVPAAYWSHPDAACMPLDAVPELVFSEAMRDADLAVSVGQRDLHERQERREEDRGQQRRISEEMYERRGELVHALLEDLGLPGVEVDGHFARVQGKLASYRVHLASAAIHIEPGQYLCIVPASRRPEKVYLPFAGEDDPKVSEIVSKVLLLANDDKIKDQSILRQIKARS